MFYSILSIFSNSLLFVALTGGVILSVLEFLVLMKDIFVQRLGEYVVDSFSQFNL